MERGILVPTLLFNLLTLELAMAASPKLAVMPLKGRRVAKETVEILDELLVGAVDRAGRYQVISASDINAILGLERMKEVVGCEDIACAADIGGALGVRYLIAGSVNRLGGELIVTLKLINVAGQRVEARAQRQGPDDEQHYRQAVEDAVVQLFGTPLKGVASPESSRAGSKPLPRASPPPKSGSERIALKVSAAGEEQGEIFLNGRHQGLKTPNLLYLKPGTYEVEVRFPSGKYGTKKVFLTGGFEKQSIAVEPTQVRRGTLRIETSPLGAAIFVNGKEVGASPVLLEDLAAGHVVVRAKLFGYKTREANVKIEPARAEQLKLQLQEVPTARLGIGFGVQRHTVESKVVTDLGDERSERRASPSSQFVTQWMLRIVSLHLKDYHLALMADVDIGGLLSGSVGAGFVVDLPNDSMGLLAGLAIRGQRKVSESSSLGLDAVLGDGNYWLLDVPLELDYSGFYILAKPSYILVTPGAERSVTGSTTTITEASGRITFYFGLGYAFTL